MIMGSRKLIIPHWICFLCAIDREDREAGGRNGKRIHFVGEIDEADREGFESCITLHYGTFDQTNIGQMRRLYANSPNFQI